MPPYFVCPAFRGSVFVSIVWRAFIRFWFRLSCDISLFRGHSVFKFRFRFMKYENCKIGSCHTDQVLIMYCTAAKGCMFKRVESDVKLPPLNEKLPPLNAKLPP